MKLRNQQREVDSLEGYSKGEILEFKKQMQQTYDEQLKRITEMVPFMSIYSDICHFMSLDFYIIFLSPDS